MNYDAIFYSGRVLEVFMKVSSNIMVEDTKHEGGYGRMEMFDLLFRIHELTYRGGNTSDMRWAYRQIESIYMSVFAFISRYDECFDSIDERKEIIKTVKNFLGIFKKSDKITLQQQL